MGRHPVERRPQRVAGVERVRIAPPLGEREGQVVDGGTAHLELQVVPRRALAVVLVVELDHLRVTEMTVVVAASVAQVDAPDERDVARRIRVLRHDQLLVMAAAATYPLVQQHLPTGLVDRPREREVLRPRRSSSLRDAIARAARAR